MIFLLKFCNLCKMAILGIWTKITGQRQRGFLVRYEGERMPKIKSVRGQSSSRSPVIANFQALFSQKNHKLAVRKAKQ